MPENVVVRSVINLDYLVLEVLREWRLDVSDCHQDVGDACLFQGVQVLCCLQVATVEPVDDFVH